MVDTNWRASANAAIYELDAALKAQDIDVLMYLNNAKKEVDIALKKREEEK